MAVNGKSINRVFPLTITTLTPLHIGTGSQLAANIDYFVDNDTTFVVNTDAALDLVVEIWQSRQESYEERLQRFQAELAAEEAAINRADTRLRQDIIQFENNPPRRPAEKERQENRLREEAARLKERKRRLAERRNVPPVPNDAGDILPPELIAGSTLDQLVETGLLPLASLRERQQINGRSLVRYAMRGQPDAGEILELMKDVADRPYLPGSSLKGAIRSALAWDLARNISISAIQKAAQQGRAKADDEIERNLFYGQPHPDRQRMNATLRDVMRTLHVGDSKTTSVEPELLEVRVHRSRSATGIIAVEAIPAGNELRATLQVERYPFENRDARNVIDFGQWQARFAPETLAAACRRRAEMIITNELKYYNDSAKTTEIARFYEELRGQLQKLEPRSFLLPVGWGAGWRSKTLDTRLRDSEEREQAFVDIVRKFDLKKHKSGTFQSGGIFPETRKVILNGDRPWRPLGWVRVDIGNER